MAFRMAVEKCPQTESLDALSWRMHSSNTRGPQEGGRLQAWKPGAAQENSEGSSQDSSERSPSVKTAGLERADRGCRGGEIWRVECWGGHGGFSERVRGREERTWEEVRKLGSAGPVQTNGGCVLTRIVTGDWESSGLMTRQEIISVLET